ncbi:hypothetical protein KY306_01905 [Candidatus Woesearchaeota archaeon]|nr:hypothetical protein [Candidatus Woesearchaeota archaeon]
MPLRDIVKELMVKYGCFQDLEAPKLSVFGEPLIYFVGVENFLDDKGKFREFGNNDQAIIGHAVQIMKSNFNYRLIIHILAERVNALFPPDAGVRTISGGETRDWLFSGPVAHLLKVPHISVFKDGRVEYRTSSSEDKEGQFKSGTLIQTRNPLSVYDIHIADVMNFGASAHDSRYTPQKGWINELRRNGITINDFIVVADRQQGGKEKLAEVGVNLHSLVEIDQDFIALVSEQPEIALAYLRDWKKWNKDYLLKHGTIAFLDEFAPERGVRGANFLKQYREFLQQHPSIMRELEAPLREKYDIQIK